MGGEAVVFDHEKLDVYRVAREFLEVTQGFAQARWPRELRDQFERASVSILANIGEGAGKMARSDKRRFYEIARGSSTETATLLDILQIRGFLTRQQHTDARALLIRVTQMLSRLSDGPRQV